MQFDIGEVSYPYALGDCLASIHRLGSAPGVDSVSAE